MPCHAMPCHAIFIISFLIVKLKGLTPLIPESAIGLRRMWENNIKMDVREITCEGGRWMELGQNPKFGGSELKSFF
jgi:hypothetical protein